MTWIILQLLFLTMPVVLSMALYKNNRRFMAVFYERMVRNDKARKLHARVLLAVLLLYHYVYTGGHPGEFGIVLSTIACAALSSVKRTDRWLRCLLDQSHAFAFFALVAMVIAGIPHLHTLAVTIAFVLLAALFYPSVRVISEWAENDINRVFGWIEHPETFAESYHDNHHAKLPHDADKADNNSAYPYNSHNNKSLKKEPK